jgi:hypothetical protein
MFPKAVNILLSPEEVKQKLKMMKLLLVLFTLAMSIDSSVCQRKNLIENNLGNEH